MNLYLFYESYFDTESNMPKDVDNLRYCLTEKDCDDNAHLYSLLRGEHDFTISKLKLSDLKSMCAKISLDRNIESLDDVWLILDIAFEPRLSLNRTSVLTIINNRLKLHYGKTNINIIEKDGRVVGSYKGTDACVAFKIDINNAKRIDDTEFEPLDSFMFIYDKVKRECLCYSNDYELITRYWDSLVGEESSKYTTLKHDNHYMFCYFLRKNKDVRLYRNECTNIFHSVKEEDEDKEVLFENELTEQQVARMVLLKG